MSAEATAARAPRTPDVRTSTTRSILTPASGFMKRYRFTLNPYAGCTFGCSYCYARYFAARLQDVEDWGRWVAVKQHARAAIEKACASGELRDGDARA